MLVSKKLKFIFAGGVAANGDKSDIKSEENLSSSGSDLSKLLYTLVELYLTLQFLFPIRNLNALITLVLLV